MVGFILKVEPKGFADGWNVNEKERGPRVSA